MKAEACAHPKLSLQYSTRTGSGTEWQEILQLTLRQGADKF